MIVLITHFLYILKKHKFDSMVKTDYLSKIRIKNEYLSCSEKLEILMPKFVLNRLDNFTMSRKSSIVVLTDRIVCCRRRGRNHHTFLRYL